MSPPLPMSPPLLAICLFLTFFVSLLASSVLTPFVRTMAHRWDFVDRPDGRRKSHRGAIALGGGVAVLLATLAAAAWGLTVASAAGFNLLASAETARTTLGLVAASMIIVTVGLIDDKIAMSGRYKLLGQIVACSILLYSGLVFEQISLLGWSGELGVMAYPFSLLWMLAAINAINLIDGVDGLASTVGLVLCVTITALAVMQENFAGAIIVLALAGALLGFLRFNFNPASIFLGDSGSMFIGLVIGAVSLSSSTKETVAMSMAVPFAVCAIPLLDSLAAIVRRKLTGRSLFATDRGHFHHSLLVRGWSVRQTVLLIGLMSAVTCAGALASYCYDRSFIAVLTVFGVIGFLIITKTFGHIEFALVRDRVHSTTSALTSRKQNDRAQVSQVRLQGSQQWDHLWSALTESAERHKLSQIELTLNLPAVHEGFFAKWKCKQYRASDHSWNLTSPLIVDGQNVGILAIIGTSPDGASLAHVGEISDFLEPIEEELRQFISELSQPADHSSGEELEHQSEFQNMAEASPGEETDTSRAVAPG